MIKPFIFFLFFILSGITINAQVSKTVECTAGGLSSLLTPTEKSTITNLTVKGIIDARDFYTMRSLMTTLNDINLSEATVIGYTGNEGTAGAYNYVYAANEIPNEGFKSRYKLQSITLPLSVTSIGSQAFGNCTNLKSVTLAPSLTSIGVSAFEGCNNLTFIEIPASVKSIPNKAFKSCINLNNLTIPPTVTSIGFEAFAYSGLTTLKLPPLLTTIVSGTFANCTKLKSITIPPSVTTIEDNAFEYCQALTSVNIPASVTYIGAFAFSNCALTSINIPNSVTFLGINAFYECGGLTAANIPSSLTQLLKYTFEGCGQLTSLTIPSSVTKIEFSALDECMQLSSIYCLSVNPTSAIEAPTAEIPYTTCTLYVPKGSKNAYSTTYPWKNFKNIVEIDGLYLSANTARVPSNGGNVKVDVMCSNEWSATSDADWLIQRKEAGKINISILSNPTGLKRSGVLTVSSAGAADQTITITQDAGITAIDKTENPSITIFPNPATTTLFINGIMQNSIISIYDLNGKMVLSTKKIDHSIDISRLANGIYTLRIADKNFHYSKKFVKQSY